jgi:NADH dehydrogenase
MGAYALQQLRKRGIDCHLGTRLESAVGGHVVLSTGEEMDTELLAWTAGVKPHPLVAATGFRLDERGRLIGRASLQVADFDDAWIAGDAAAIPDLANGPGTWTSPSAQHAVRQAKLLGDNLIAALRGFPVKDYEHKHVGSVASLGLYKGVAQVYGIKTKGVTAWLMHRAYHMSRMPTFARKAQVVIDWTQAFFFRREIVSLWGMHEPFSEFQRAAAGPTLPEGTTAGAGDPRPS